MIIGIEDLFYFFGLVLFGIWLLKTSMGKRALDQTPTRRTNMHPLIILVALLVWQAPPALILYLVESFFEEQPEWVLELVRYSIMDIGAILAVICFCVLAWFTFGQRLKGLGMRLRGLHKDFGRAVIILFCLQPLVLSMVVTTEHIGQWIKGPDHKMEYHEGLVTLQKYPQPVLKFVVVITAVLVAPIVEEMLFRGLLQTLFRSYLGRPWLSIVLCSFLFVTVHANVTHWPALFVLSMGMGYAYEQSGSLWQSIFIHALFNGSAVIPYL